MLPLQFVSPSYILFIVKKKKRLKISHHNS